MFMSVWVMHMSGCACAYMHVCLHSCVHVHVCAHVWEGHVLGMYMCMHGCVETSPL